MENLGSLIPISHRQEQLITILQGCNCTSVRYGLSLNENDMEMLAKNQAEVLRSTGRIEFFTGPYEKLVYALCDSPYITQADYANTLAMLCTIFYHFKTESHELWSDDELIEAIKLLYNGECQGSLNLVEDRLWQAIHSHPDEIDFMREDDAFEE